MKETKKHKKLYKGYSFEMKNRFGGHSSTVRRANRREFRKTIRRDYNKYIKQEINNLGD